MRNTADAPSGHWARLIPALLLLGITAQALAADAPPPAPTLTLSPLIASPKEADPDAPRGLIANEPGAMAGYTLFAPLQSKSIYLIDMQGEVVHTWVADSAPGAWVYLLPDGSLLRLGREDENPHYEGGGIGGRIQKLAPDSKILWSSLVADAERTQHHDAEPLPNGNVLIITWESVSRDEAIGRGRAADQVGGKGLWPDAILELRPTPPSGAEVVWEWHSWNHLIQDSDPALPNFGDPRDHPGRIDINGDHKGQAPLSDEEIRQEKEMEEQLRALGYIAGGADEEEEEAEDAVQQGMRGGDWLHTNGVAYHPERDLIALSTPRFNEVWVIDHSTTTAEAASSKGGRYGHGGDLLWRWGNERSYGMGDEDDRKLFRQHDPTWVLGRQPSELRLLVFNNGQSRGHSSVDELALPFDVERGFAREAGKPFGPDAPAWSYDDPEGFFSAFISGAQRLPNGNTLICSGTAGRIFEVTPDRRLVWEYRNPYGGDVPPPENAGGAPPQALFRATRLALDHPGVLKVLATKR